MRRTGTRALMSGGLHKRAVAVATVLIFNAALFYGIGCTYLCAFRTCAPQPNRSSEDRCHNQHGPASNRHGDPQNQDCSAHGHPTASFMITVAPNVTPSLESRTGWAVRINLVSHIPTPLITRRDILSHSPPGFATGRMLCQKKAVLLI